MPSLRQALETAPFDPDKVLLLAVPVDPDAQRRKLPAQMNRHCAMLNDGRNAWEWQIDSMAGLFRGTNQPPVLGDYPQAYDTSFMLLDMHALELSKIYGARRDTEMKEVYSMLRRRPDGKSLGFVHDYMWQAAALMLATEPLSQAEYEAILARLERSCRRFEQGASSRNYIDCLTQTFKGSPERGHP